MLRHRRKQFMLWLLSVEVTKTSILHWSLYIWLCLGLLGVGILEVEHNRSGFVDTHPESLSTILGNFWWQPWIWLVLVCVLLFFLSQGMIFKCPNKKVTYSGYAILLGADSGEFLAVSAFFVAMYAKADMSASMNWFRMCMAGFIIVALLVFVIRDFHRLALIEVVRVKRERVRKHGNKLD